MPRDKNSFVKIGLPIKTVKRIKGKSTEEQPFCLHPTNASFESIKALHNTKNFLCNETLNWPLYVFAVPMPSGA